VLKRSLCCAHHGLTPHRRLQFHETHRAFLCVSGLRAYGTEEEADPWLKITGAARTKEEVVVLIPVALQVHGQVEQRLRQDRTLDQNQRNEETPIPVQERMDHLELVVGHREMNQERNGSVVKELLEVVERRVHCVDGWRHEHRVGRRRAAYPVLAPSELPRRRVAAAYACHQSLVRLAEQSQARRRFRRLRPQSGGDQ